MGSLILQVLVSCKHRVLDWGLEFTILRVDLFGEWNVGVWRVDVALAREREMLVR